MEITLQYDGPSLVESTLYYYVATKDGKKQPSPNRVQVVTGKEQQYRQEKDTKAKERELNQKKNSDDTMFVLF